MSNAARIIDECFHRVLKEWGTETETRLRLVADLRSAMADHKRLTMAYIVAGTAPDGKPRAELSLAPSDPASIVIPLPIAKWRKAFKRQLYTQFVATPGHPTVQ